MIYAGFNHCENATVRTNRVTYEKATGEKALAEKGLVWNIS